jgi:hypothetical protein
MVANPVALNRAEADQETGMKIEGVEGVAGDEITVGIPGRMSGVGNVMAVHGEDGAQPEFGKAAEKILHVGSVAVDELGVEGGQEAEAAVGMEAVEEGGAGNGILEDLVALLEEVASAGGLAEGAQDAEPDPLEIVEGAVAIDGAEIVFNNMEGRGHELFAKRGLGGVGVEGGKGRRE